MVAVKTHLDNWIAFKIELKFGIYLLVFGRNPVITEIYSRNLIWTNQASTLNWIGKIHKCFCCSRWKIRHNIIIFSIYLGRVLSFCGRLWELGEEILFCNLFTYCRVERRRAERRSQLRKENQRVHWIEFSIQRYSVNVQGNFSFNFPLTMFNIFRYSLLISIRGF